MNITFALYGRMEVNRCVTQDYGHIPCFQNVVGHLHTMCSGRPSCTVEIPDRNLDQIKNCPNDFKTYLQVDYRCIPGRSISLITWESLEWTHEKFEVQPLFY